MGTDLRSLGFAGALALCSLMAVAGASAQGSAEDDSRIEVDPGSPSGASIAPGDEPPAFGAEASSIASTDPEEGTASLSRSVVTRQQMQERQARSAPEALRFEPGVSIQQTAHAQASPYVRGMTGQRVLHAFDGIRLNHGIYRRGPNQYFFTVDAHTLGRLEVVRGSASTRFGTDALGGAILASPREPYIDRLERGLSFHPRAYFRLASADRELGGRLELELNLGPRTALLAGAGYRDLGLLRTGGPTDHRVRPSSCDDPDALVGPRRGECAPWVPRFAEETEAPDPRDRDRWRTQLGTGFREATYDARLVHQLDDRLRLIAAVYGYQQMDAPRTDRCPAPEAPLSECLRIEAQGRSLAYLSLRGSAGAPMQELELTAAYQLHQEHRVLDRPRSNLRFDHQDRVGSLSLSLRAATAPLQTALGPLILRYGAEAARDGVRSSSQQRFTDLGLSLEASRGQYLDGSLYATLGAHAEAELSPWSWLRLRAGGRVGLVGVRAPGDPESGSASLRANYPATIGRVGIELRPSAETSILLNLDQGFRAPNLDDLSARQEVGPGFQFENAALREERTSTYELGLEARWAPLEISAWAFATLLDDAIQRAPRGLERCPPSTPACLASRTRFQLINADDRSVILGAEGGATLRLGESLLARATLSYAWGEGPSPIEGVRERVPLSRIPPLGGALEGRWRDLGTGLYAAFALRFAWAQSRLAPVDLSDPRIPIGGTPGYALIDLRLGWRWGSRLAIHAALENLLDSPWRTHGSSLGGAGRGGILSLEGGF
ncbi:MAG: TonB-dependent receptor [Myxococcales bacterium]|nr:TonB-dependent receptor [Myxococcales bacterium]